MYFNVFGCLVHCCCVTLWTIFNESPIGGPEMTRSAVPLLARNWPHIFFGFSTLKASPCGHVRARPGIHRGMKNLSACTLPYSYLLVWFALRSILLLWDQKYFKKWCDKRLAQSVACKQIGTNEFQQENHSPGADRN